MKNLTQMHKCHQHTCWFFEATNKRVNNQIENWVEVLKRAIQLLNNYKCNSNTINLTSYQQTGKIKTLVIPVAGGVQRKEFFRKMLMMLEGVNVWKFFSLTLLINSAWESVSPSYLPAHFHLKEHFFC